MPPILPMPLAIDGTEYRLSESIKPNTLLYPWFDSGEIKSLKDFMQAGLTDLSVYLVSYINSLPGGGGGGGTVNTVTGTAPITVTGTATDRVVGITLATTSTSGYLSSANWNTFNDKQALLVNQVNIKSINGQTLLGSGDLAVSGGTSTEEVQDIVGTMIVAGSNMLVDYDDLNNIVTLSSTATGGGAYAAIPNHGIEIIGSEIGTAYNTLIADTVNSVAVGGAPSLPASTWKTKNLVEVMDTILFPDVLPTYTIPTITFTSSVSGTYEVGQTVSPLLTTVGSEHDSGPFTQIRTRRNGATISTNSSPSVLTITDVPPQFGYVDPNNPNRSYTATFTDSNYVVISGTTTYDARGDYSAGVAKKNNKGVTDVRAAAVRSVNAPQAASTDFSTATAVITGIYPYFWGKSATQPTPASIAADIASGITNKSLTTSTGTVTVTYNAASEFIWVAIPAISTIKTTWFNTTLNSGPIGAGQFILAPVLQNVNSPDLRWSALSFNIYISGYASTTSGAIEYRN